MAEPRRAEPVASGARARGYPHLSVEHRDLINQAIAHARDQQPYSEGTLQNYSNALCRLANDLGARGQATDLRNHQSLVDHVDAFFPTNDNMRTALSALRRYHEPGYSATAGARATSFPHLSDEHRDVINQAIAHARTQQQYRENTLKKYTFALRRLANDLGARGQATDLKNHQSLVDHVDAFFPKNDDTKTALSVLRRYHEPGYSATADARATRFPHLSGEHWDVIDQAIAHARTQKHHSDDTLRIYSNALCRLANDLGARGQATDLKNHQSLVDHLDTVFPKTAGMKAALSVLRAYHEPGYSATARRLVPSKADAHILEQVNSDSSLASGTRAAYGRNLRRFSEALESRGQTISGLDHDSRIELAKRLFPDKLPLISALERVRNTEPVSNGIREAVRPLFDDRADEPQAAAIQQPLSEIGNSDTYRGVSLVDLTTSSDAQIGAFPSGSSNLPEGAVLGATQWLSDVHIQRDYRLLEQDLQETQPALAARTRLVNASLSHLLRTHDVDVQSTLLSIYHQNDAPADFVFLPVNDGTLGGTHWSLLLVDRRDPERAVAYHYDSFQPNGQPYNDAPARLLAIRLDALLLQTPDMARQNNGVDCGVFVLDGTRELVHRLANEERPYLQLDLDYLVADRQALQNRLREQRLPHELAAIPASYPLPDAGQARQAGFEQHVAEPRRAEPVASGARANGYPHLSVEHRDLINQAIAHARDQQQYRERTLRNYSNALCRLANDLGARGQATDLRNHQSLVDHVDAFFPTNDTMRTALSVLRRYHEPGYSATAGARATSFPHLSDEHRDVIDQAIAHARTQQQYRETTEKKYTLALRQLANDLGARGQATDLKNHQSLVDHVDAVFPTNDTMKTALSALRRYYEPGYSATIDAPAIRFPHLSGEHRDVIDQAIAHARTQQRHSEDTLQIYSNALCRLANDLGARGQATDLRNHQSLVDHADAVFPKYGTMKTALNFLRAYHEPGYSATARRLVPSKADAHILEQVTRDSSLASSTRAAYGRSLRRFSEALESRGQTISGLDHDSRIELAKRLLPGDRYLRLVLERVRNTELVSNGVPEAVRREELQRGQNDQAASSFFSNPGMPAVPDGHNRSVSDAFAAAGSGHAGVEAAAPPALAASQQQIRSSPDALDQGNHLPPEWVIINNEHDTALLRPAKRQRANTPQAAAIQQPLSEIGNSGGRVPMQPPMQQLGELPLEGVPVQGTGSEHIGRLHAEAAPSAWSEEPPAAIEDSIDVSFAVPKGFSHGTQRVPDAMLSRLYHFGFLPDAEKPQWNYEIEGHGYTAERAEGPNDFLLVHRGPISEAAEAAVPARAPGPASPATARLSDTYRGVPLVDLTTSSDAQIGAFPSGSSNLPEGAVLGATQWLSDVHIQRDYRLLEQDLQEAQPALAARTRLVDASLSHLLRTHDVDVQSTLLSIYHQNDAPADFVFLPVNDGTLGGTHWSLLLVDRRDPERAVAYHYDSFQPNGQPYNDAPARLLAIRLDALLLQTPDMARQNNGVDCGVFVLDGTRELVHRLANEERPYLQLDLDYLVADRQALQNRLREQRLPHELAAIPADAIAAAGSQVQHAVLQEQQARQVAPAPFDRHLGKSREAQDELTSTLDRNNLVNSGGVINNEHDTALLRPAKRQRADNPQSLAMGRQLSEATTTSVSQASDQARADLMASFRSRDRSDAGR
ncbi:C48 family peptidase (plasmid) [Rhizobium sullae]|uniref:C48 family peptidase n=1 Tax=Rhizobium sullae TaxID=50338 RepID=A0ABY5XY44_RHISU|nr:C48 family peptidase [Rhizobium sullae]UWU19423.1 C48 family peptidase [Rhizobium sullae]